MWGQTTNEQKTKITTKWNYSKKETLNRDKLLNLLKNNPLPDDQIVLKDRFIFKKTRFESNFISK